MIAVGLQLSITVNVAELLLKRGPEALQMAYNWETVLLMHSSPRTLSKEMLGELNPVMANAHWSSGPEPTPSLLRSMFPQN
jgi:hypothetical protein